eukprot:1854034-Lingulodinium_polyedra.AAC.1
MPCATQLAHKRRKAGAKSRFQHFGVPEPPCLAPRRTATRAACTKQKCGSTSMPSNSRTTATT